ncbi:MAG: DUF2330 domain-containing protein [Labilithrix sp.]|nr:DUF2330 domain-containing protein [Labilithrix sp.]MBX3220230.1 DUF2330 domain-containing protein [Labilithrix sp.]
MAAGLTLVGEDEARACGGCFVPQVESTVVNDHRMVFAVSQEHTILWDQIEYSGDPKEFAWVLPVRRGTRVELSRDAWIAALDSTTRPRIVQPAPPFSGDDGCSMGCASSDALSASFADGAGAPAVQVVSQSVVGPYETVTLRSEDAQALQTWLRDNGYTVPPPIEPVIAAYTEERLDFIALKLRPGQGVRAMKPVRIVTPGADATLPLRMVAAGVGANVGLTLFVISEGRYRPQNFPEVAIDASKLVWKSAESRSNYQELSLETMAAAPGGRGWLVEWANRPTLLGNPTGSAGRGGGAGTLHDAYYSECSGPTPSTYPSVPPEPAPSEDEPVDAGVDGPDDGDGPPDGGVNDPDEGDDGGPPDAAAEPPSSGETYGDAGSGPPAEQCGESSCCAFDDLELAIAGMNRADVWVTRLRANLPVAALNEDLRLEAHPTQESVSGFYVARAEPSVTASIAPLRRGRIAGSATLTLGVTFLVSRILRRRRRS